MRVVALPGYQHRLAIALEVRDGHGMGLRPGVVNVVFYPAAFALRVLLLFVPENSVVVAEAGDEIRQAVAVHVHRVDESGFSQVEFRMEDPLAVARVDGSFKPSLGRDDVHAPVTVDVPRADAMSIAVGADHVPHPVRLLALAYEFEPFQRGIG